MSTELKEDSISFFVIAKKESAELITTIMKAGAEGDEEAVLAFTCQSSAEEYLQQAGWAETDTVAELQPSAFLKWLVQSTENYSTLIAINPDYKSQAQGSQQAVLLIEEALNRLGPALADQLIAEKTAT